VNEVDARILRSIARALEFLVDAIRKHTEAIHVNQEAANRRNEPNPKPSTPVVNVTLEMPVEVTEYYRSKSHEKPPSKFWRWAKNTLETIAVLGALGLLYFNIRTFKEVKRQAKAAQDQVGVMQKQLESSERPWLAVEAYIDGPLTFKVPGGQVGLLMAVKFRLINKGHSPAQAAFITADLFPMTKSLILTDRQKDICERGSHNWPSTSPIGVIGKIIFAGDTAEDMHNFSVMKRDIDNALQDPPVGNTNGTMLFLSIAGCVNYGSSVPNKEAIQTPETTTERSVRAYQTGFIFHVFRVRTRTSTELSYPDAILPSEGVIPMSSLDLVKELTGNYAY
jgi:hypothetical protein